MITDKFIHIHIPKTAGQFVRGLIHQKRSHWKIFIEDSHISLGLAHEKLKKSGYSLDGIKSFAFTRNPWDYYVSRYFHRREMIKNGHVKENIPLEQIGDSVEDFHEHMRQLNKFYEKNDCVRRADNSRAGTRTYMYITVSEWHEKLTAPGVDFIGRFENVADDAARILHTVAPEVFNEDTIRNRMKRTKVNTSPHLHYSKYYEDKEIADIVAKWDKEYITKFKYSL